MAYVTPYGTGGALYLHPILFGLGPHIGLQPANKYTLLIMLMTVTDYYKGGIESPVDALIVEEYDRSATCGWEPLRLPGIVIPIYFPTRWGRGPVSPSPHI